MKTIHYISIRSNRTDIKIKDRLCWGTRHRTGPGEVVFVLEQTRNWFARNHFELQPGFKAIPENDLYEYMITGISYEPKRPFKTILTTVRT